MANLTDHVRQIPFFNYPALFAESEAEFMAVIGDVLRRGAYIMQRDLAEFEQELAKYLGVRHVIGVADGTMALFGSVVASGIGRESAESGRVRSAALTANLRARAGCHTDRTLVHVG